MTVDCRELNNIITPIHVAQPNITTILGTLATVLGVSHAVLDLTKAFSWPLSQKIDLPSYGRDNIRSFKCFPKITYIAPPYVMGW